MKLLFSAAFFIGLTTVSLAQCPPVDVGNVPELIGVVRATGMPIGGAQLSVEPADRKRPPVHATLGPDGHFRLVKLPPGKYILLVHRKGLPDNRYTVQLAPRAAHKPLVITLPMAGNC